MLKGTIRPPVLKIRNEKIILRHVIAMALSRFFRTFPDRFKSVANLLKDLEHPSAVSDFRAFLHTHNEELVTSLKTIVPPDMLSQIGLMDGSWIHKIAGEDSRFSLAEEEVSSDHKNVIKVRDEAISKLDGKTLEWAENRAKTIASEDVLSFLSRKAVIPKYGFPVDVVELDTQKTLKNSEASSVLFQRDLSLAIAEFAPRSQIIANKALWTSYGLKKVAEREWPRRFYKRCVHHNVFLQWGKGGDEPPSPCGDTLSVFEYITPQFGFVADRSGPKKPRGRTIRMLTTRPYFAGPLQPDVETISLPLHSPLLSIKKASPGLMVILCEGLRGNGFYICEACGSGFLKREVPHKDPYGRVCRGSLTQVSLGHEFVTDVLQLQFHLRPRNIAELSWFAHSLAYALLEGAAEVLEVPSTDLNVIVGYHGGEGLPPIILYDDVPGGAGLVAHLESESILLDCLKAAQHRVSGMCGCSANTSCYGCLRSYRNQFAHVHLQRGPVYEYLEAILGQWS